LTSIAIGPAAAGVNRRYHYVPALTERRCSVPKTGADSAAPSTSSIFLSCRRAVQYFAQLHLADVELQCFLRDAKKIIRSVG
jgi:hypothetical protein